MTRTILRLLLIANILSAAQAALAAPSIESVRREIQTLLERGSPLHPSEKLVLRALGLNPGEHQGSMACELLWGNELRNLIDSILNRAPAEVQEAAVQVFVLNEPLNRAQTEVVQAVAQLRY